MASAPPFPIGIPAPMAESIQITLPDGSQKPAPDGIASATSSSESIGAGLAKAARARQAERQARWTRRARSTRTRSWRSSPPRPPRRWRSSATTPRTSWPSAVQRLFPGTQVTIGPAIEDGFYYDFFRDKPFTPEDLEKIEAEANEDHRRRTSRSSARRSRPTRRSRCSRARARSSRSRSSRTSSPRARRR